MGREVETALQAIKDAESRVHKEAAKLNNERKSPRKGAGNLWRDLNRNTNMLLKVNASEHWIN